MRQQPGRITRTPLFVNPAYAGTDVRHANSLRLPRLRSSAKLDSAEDLYPTRMPSDYSYLWADWPNKFGDLLMLEFQAIGNPQPENVSPDYKGTFFTIYRVCPPTVFSATGHK